MEKAATNVFQSVRNAKTALNVRSALNVFAKNAMKNVTAANHVFHALTVLKIQVAKDVTSLHVVNVSTVSPVLLAFPAFSMAEWLSEILFYNAKYNFH